MTAAAVGLSVAQLDVAVGDVAANTAAVVEHLARARAAGVDIAAALADNDCYACLGAIGDLLRLGPTGTNVGDLQLLLVDPA